MHALVFLYHMMIYSQKEGCPTQTKALSTTEIRHAAASGDLDKVLALSKYS